MAAIPQGRLYADIVVPVARGIFTYEVADALHPEIAEGRCVMVQLGENKHYTGVVWRLHGERPPFKVVKTVNEYVPNAPQLPATEMRFWEWMAEYYMCSLGEVMRAALPSALKPSGFSREEFSRDVRHPAVVQYISLGPAASNQFLFNETFEKTARSRRQYRALVSLAEALGEERLFTGEVPRQRVDGDMTVLRALAKKGVVRIESRQLEPGQLPPLPARLPELTSLQARAYDSIKDHFHTKDIVLLHGVTGSGKTEIYIRLIAEQLQAGRNVLYLMPEIVMTSQIIERIKAYFGERVVAYHSRFTDRARMESYLRVNRSRGGELILGVRSAVFLPLENLGLVIVDEEHDPSYKQTEPAPRYHARDCAIMLARISGAKALLGSATPAIETYVNATEGKYGYVPLTERYGGAPLPRVIVSDTLRAVKRGERTAHFNKLLLDKIAETLAAGEQTMLFQNRRGFSPYVECAQCGWVAACPRCNVTLTLHKADNSLRCHYCGHSAKATSQCPSCGKNSVELRGFGTEKVEEELARLFPEARIARLDRDTTHTVRQYNSIISRFGQGETDILIGTQMITKGFDFAGLSLVGILNADNMLNYPDFRASERAFQTMMQVAGRAGRRDRQGEVVVQTSQPDNPVVRAVAAGDYSGMAAAQLAERKSFFYPPYCRLISITLKHRDKDKLWATAGQLAKEARKIFGKRLLGPQPPLVDRIKGEYLLTLLLKVERTASFARAKKHLAAVTETVRADKKLRSVTIVFDVDPQ